jgi:uncharacterized membrane protein YphA (DoxX/SURF4 family)
LKQMMKRLYSSFPNGNAAIGLALLRVLSGAGLAEQSRSIAFGFFAAPASHGGTLSGIAAVCALAAGILIVIGLWTWVAASIALPVGIASAVLGIEPLHSLFFASLSFAVALVGPGAFSLDARLFGWRQIRFPNNKTQQGQR